MLGLLNIVMENNKREHMTLEDEAALTDDKQIKFPQRTIWISVLIFIFMLTVAIVWFKIINNSDWLQVSLGDIGAMLSGTFTALAWYWFVEAYLIQTKELRYQRLDLRKSIKAQQGSEEALKSQSNALKKQLSITENQFELYLSELRDRRPLFEVFHQELNIKSKIEDRENTNFGRSLIGNRVTVINGLVVVLANIKGNCNVKKIGMLDDQNNIHSYNSLNISLVKDKNQSYFNNTNEYVTLFFRKITNEVKDRKIIQREYINSMIGRRFQIKYSYSNTSSTDIYEFYLDNRDCIQVKLLS